MGGAPLFELRELAVRELLAEGPRRLDEVVAELDERGLLEDVRDDLAEELDLWDEPDDDGDGHDDDDDEDEAAEVAAYLVDELLLTDEVWATPDQLLMLVASLTDGLVLTHRLTSEEVEEGRVRVSPDLVLLDWHDPDDDLELEGGGRLAGVAVPGALGDPAVAGPEGWLDAFAPGDLVAFTWVDGRIRVAPAGELADDAAVVALLAAAGERRIPEGEGDEVDAVILDALAADPTAFRRPFRPLGELLVAAGFEPRENLYGRAGEPWRTLAEHDRERHRERVIADWRMDRCCVAALEEVERALGDDEPGSGGADLDALAVALAHGAVAPALAEVVLGAEVGGDERLARFAQAVVAGVPPKRAAPALLLVAVEAERRGDALAAEAALRTALRHDPGYGLAARELADYVVDRGDLAQALTLVRHPDLSPTESAIALLEDLHAETGGALRGVGRNDPCTCGSGRKFKVCCQRDPKVPLRARTSLLVYKLAHFAAADHRRRTLVGLATSAADPDSPTLLFDLRDLVFDRVIVDLAVFEGGAGDAYLDQRGPLLPADERDLLEVLLEEPRRLWEVTKVDPGTGLTLSDAGTGEVVVVVERRGSHEVAPGDLLLARVAEVDGERQVIGIPIEVAPPLRDSALTLLDSRPDADALAEWYGQNRSSET